LVFPVVAPAGAVYIRTALEFTDNEQPEGWKPAGMLEFSVMLGLTASAFS